MTALLALAIFGCIWAIGVRRDPLAPSKVLVALGSVVFLASALAVPAILTEPRGLRALAYLAILTVAFSLACGLSFPVKFMRASGVVVPKIRLRVPRVLFPSMLVAGIAAAIVAAVVANTAGFEGLSSLQDLAALATQNSSARYSGTAGNSVMTSALLCLAFATSLIAPFAVLAGNRHYWLYLTLPSLSLVPYTLVTTAKLPAFVSICSAFAGWLGVRILRTGATPLMSRRVVMVSISVLGLVWLVFLGSNVLRTGTPDTRGIDAAVSKQSSYSTESISAFALWFDDYLSGTSFDSDLGQTWGAASLPGVGLLTGIDRYETRAYQDAVDVSGSGLGTNLYTAGRQLVLDFSPAGAIVVAAALGWIFGRCCQLVVRRRSLPATGFVVIVYSVIPSVSSSLVTTFSNVFLSLVALLLFTIILRKRLVLTDDPGSVALAEREDAKHTTRAPRRVSPSSEMGNTQSEGPPTPGRVKSDIRGEWS